MRFAPTPAVMRPPATLPNDISLYLRTDAGMLGYVCLAGLDCLDQLCCTSMLLLWPAGDVKQIVIDGNCWYVQ